MGQPRRRQARCRYSRTFRVRAPPSPRNRVIAALRVKDLDQPGKIGERPGQPVDLVDDHDVDPVSPDIGEQALQRRPLDPSLADA
jgi:hypothetical protein